MYLNQHKGLVASESYYVVITAEIPVDRTARRMEENIAM
jgi:hypothetical protein